MNENTGCKEAEISYSARSHAFAKAGWAKIAADVQSPWAAASVSAAVAADAKKSGTNRMVYITGRFKLNTGTVQLPLNVEPSDQLMQAVDTALSIKNQKVSRAKLENIFETFGHVFVTRVSLGGELISGYIAPFLTHDLGSRVMTKETMSKDTVSSLPRRAGESLILMNTCRQKIRNLLQKQEPQSGQSSASQRQILASPEESALRRAKSSPRWTKLHPYEQRSVYIMPHDLLY